MSTTKRGVNDVDVGAQLKKLRESRQISMRTLAKASNLSANALSMIERGLTSPSVSTLSKLAGALEVPITAFFRPEPMRKKIVYRTATERTRRQLQRGMSEDLGGDEFAERLEAFNVTLDPGENSGNFALGHSGSEFVIVSSGQVDYEVDGQLFHMRPGDSLMFAPGLHHRWSNPGADPAAMLLIVSAYAENDRPGEFHQAAGNLIEENGSNNT